MSDNILVCTDIRFTPGTLLAWILAVWCCQIVPICARADLLLLQRETFQGVGTLDAGSPGNLGAVSGTLAKRAAGPRLSTDLSADGRGWSADTLLQNDVGQTITNATALPPGSAFNTGDGVFFFDWWIYLDGAAGDGSSGKTLCQLTSGASGRTLLFVGTAGDGLSLTCGTNAAVVGSFSTVPYAVVPRQWTNLRMAWTKRTDGYFDYDASLLVRVAGGAWSTVAEFVDGRVYGNLSALTAGFKNAGGNPLVRGRYGMPSLYRIGGWSERTAPVPDVLDPPAGPFVWYCNPATGNDSNDGATPATAWASVDKINAESVNLGIFERNTFTNGDSLIIDTTGANLLLGASSLNLSTRGLNVTQIGGGPAGTGEIQAWASIPAEAWTGPVSGTTKTYQTLLTEANPSCVLWEDDRWLNHPTGTDLTAVSAALEATPGSFWTDGTTLYAHPFGDTDPRGDAKLYTRSYHRGAPFGSSAVMILAADTHLNGLRVRKTCLADKSTNDPVAAYCIQTLAGAGGASLLENCVCTYGSKHIYGFTDNDLARQYVVNDCAAEQASPYTSAGGQTAWVDYSSATGTGTAASTYNRCTTMKNAGLIGSRDGDVKSDQPAWLSHNNGSANNQFAAVTFNDCNLAGGLGTFGAVAKVNYLGGSCANAGLNNSAGTFSRVLFTAGMPSCVGTNGSMTVRNSLMVIPRINGGGEAQAEGIVDVQNCTVDLRATLSNTDDLALYTRLGALAMTWRNNLVLGSTDYHFGVLKTALSTDALVFDHNCYQNLPFVAFNYDDGQTTADRDFGQWQSLGKDPASLVAGDVRVDRCLRPLADSPLIDLGTDSGLGTDYSGASFPVRNDGGAYEYPLPVLRGVTPQTVELTEGAALDLAVQTAGDGPFTFQWQQDGTMVANATGTGLHLPNVQPAQSGAYTVIVSNDNGSVTSVPVTVLIHPLTFMQWQTARFTPGQLADPSICGATAPSPDGSGLANLQEYAFGVLPDQSGTAVGGIMPEVAMTADTTDGSSHLTVRYRRLLNAVGLGYTVEVSDDLVSWDASQGQVETVGAAVPVGDGRTEAVTVRLKLPVNALLGPGKFLRVCVTAASQ